MLTFHVLLSLVMLLPGVVIVAAMFDSRVPRTWTAAYLVLAVLTSATGFLLPAPGFLPSHAVGILSLILLGAAIVSLYVFHLVGAWRWIYAISIVLSLYFDVFVAVVQAFQKISFLNPLAPTGSEPPFAIAQSIVLVIAIALCVLAFRRFRPMATA